MRRAPLHREIAMRIKFKSHDPRSGMVVEMDSRLGQQFVDEGNADLVSENAVQPPAEDPGKGIVTGTAPDVLERIATISDAGQLRAALAAENEGKRRKSVVDALESAIKDAEKKAD